MTVKIQWILAPFSVISAPQSWNVHAYSRAYQESVKDLLLIVTPIYISCPQVLILFS